MSESEEYSNFIQDEIDRDNASGRYGGAVITRFPPEPNGYLHIGHAKAICIDFGLAIHNNGRCNLRFDDTNPVKEDTEYVDSIIEDVKWLGFDIGDNVYYASDYFDEIYKLAVKLIKKGKAYVCDLSADETRTYRGTLTEPGKNSPFRDRTVEENLDLFEKMKKGEFPDGDKVLRARIDMSSPNMNMRDPVLYRILTASHHRTGDKWCIYPMYDFAHPIEDSIEGITHSTCSIEFEDHRPLYDWVINECEMHTKTRQIEFARLYMTNLLTSKRKLKALVDEGIVDSWDDPRMPTICGMRRRGYTPAAIRDFIDRIGVSKTLSVVDFALLEHCVREDLNKTSKRVMAVLNPLKVIIDNYPDGLIEEFQTENNPENPEEGTRTIKFSKEIYIEQNDFMEEPPKKYFRLFPGAEVRLKNTYYIKCESVVKDNITGEILEIHCSYDPESRGGSTPDGRKVKGTIHWVSAQNAIECEVRLYNQLFVTNDPEEDNEDGDFRKNINPESVEILTNCKVEASLENAKPEENYQFIRTGYFTLDSAAYKQGKLVFNRTLPLKDSWAKIVNK